jgi:hypothetical protein
MGPAKAGNEPFARSEAAAGAAPLLTISATGAWAAKLSKPAVRYKDLPKERREDRLAWSRRRALYWRNDNFEGERP